ncbi:hypothetical protein ACHAXN_002872 [Cyclotella atomus]
MATGHVVLPQQPGLADPKGKSPPIKHGKSYKKLLSRGESMASLSSFTSRESVNSDPGQVVEVGNLRFLKDEEMEGGQSSILGRGSFAMVRLAWRKTPARRLSSISDVSEAVGESFASSMDISTPNQETELNVKNFPQFDATPQKSTKEELVAVKIFHKSILRDCKTMSQDSSHHLQVRTALENVEREIAVMKMLQHPNLVSLYEVIDSEEMEKLYMVIEYIPLGEIMSYVPKTDRYKRRERREGEPELRGVTKEGYFDEEHCALYFVDLLHGLAHLHRHHICHRDLKPENILLDVRGYVKISDFGVSHLFEDEESSVGRASVDLATPSYESRRPARLSRRESDAAAMMKSMSNIGKLSKTEGTWCFWSPEMCAENSLTFSGYACDMWAAGICVYIFATGKIPFFSEIPLVLFDMIAEAKLPDMKSLGLSGTLIVLLKKVLAKDPSNRAGVGDCLQHQFCTAAREQRLRELGDEVERLDENLIVPQRHDLQQALSVTKRSSAQDIASKFSQRLSLVRKHFSSSRSISREDSDENKKQIRRRSQRQRTSLNSFSKQEMMEDDTPDQNGQPILIPQDSTVSLTKSLVCTIQ